MKKVKLVISFILAFVIVSCSTSKKSTTTMSSTPAATNNSTNEPASQGPYLLMPPPNDIKAPGNEELTAIQIQYKDITLEKLKQGHVIYTETACVKCHVAQSIYKYDVITWKSIINDMSARAEISETEKDAVYKYVLAIKATQPK